MGLIPQDPTGLYQSDRRAKDTSGAFKLRCTYCPRSPKKKNKQQWLRAVKQSQAAPWQGQNRTHARSEGGAGLLRWEGQRLVGQKRSPPTGGRGEAAVVQLLCSALIFDGCYLHAPSQPCRCLCLHLCNGSHGTSAWSSSVPVKYGTSHCRSTTKAADRPKTISVLKPASVNST